MQSAMLCLVAQPCSVLCNPMACRPPGSPVHGASPGKNTGAGCLALLQGIFPTQGSYLSLLHCKQILYHLSRQWSSYAKSVPPNHYFTLQAKSNANISVLVWNEKKSQSNFLSAYSHGNLKFHDFYINYYFNWLPVLKSFTGYEASGCLIEGQGGIGSNM